MKTTHEPLYLDTLNLVQWKIMGIPTSFIWIIILFDKSFEHDVGAKFWGCVGKDAAPLCVEFCIFFLQWCTFVN
jgi:hypothetical protein